MKRLLAVAMAAAVVLTAAAAYACASTATAPTETPTPATATATDGASSTPLRELDAFLIFRDDFGTLSVKDYKTAATHVQPVDGAKEVISVVRCTKDGSRISYLKQIFADAEHRQLILRGENAPADSFEVSSLTLSTAWSPDGSKIVLVTWDARPTPRVGTISIMDVATGASTLILEGDEYVGNIGWSPDGQWLGFYLQSSDYTKSDIYKMRPDGTDLTLLTSGEGELVWIDPDWSPDGTWLAATGQGEQSAQIYRVEADGSGYTQLSQSTDIYKRSPYFSPDGSIIAFTGSVVQPNVSANWATAAHTFGIFQMSIDGSNERALTEDPRGTTPGPNDPFLNAFLLGWCAPGPWLDNLWSEVET